MAKKIRMTRTQVIEYVPNPAHYPDGSSIEDMAKFDAESDDLESVFTDLVDESVTYTILDNNETKKE